MKDLICFHKYLFFYEVLSKPDLRISELRVSYKDFEEEEKEK